MPQLLLKQSPYKRQRTQLKDDKSGGQLSIGALIYISITGFESCLKAPCTRWITTVISGKFRATKSRGRVVDFVSRKLVIELPGTELTSQTYSGDTRKDSEMGVKDGEGETIRMCVCVCVWLNEKDNKWEGACVDRWAVYQSLLREWFGELSFDVLH